MANESESFNGERNGSTSLPPVTLVCVINILIIIATSIHTT